MITLCVKVTVPNRAKSPTWQSLLWLQLTFAIVYDCCGFLVGSWLIQEYFGSLGEISGKSVVVLRQIERIQQVVWSLTERNQSPGHNEAGTLRQTACLFDRNNNVSCYEIKADLPGISKEKGERQNSSRIAPIQSTTKPQQLNKTRL